MEKFDIRWATEDDRPAIISTIREVYNGEEDFAKMADFFTSTLHASGRPETTCVAIDKDNGKVAAVEITAPMIWTYEGISIKVQVLLLTGTHPDYRGCNVMPLIHKKNNEWLVENGFDISFVDGIPWYYRRLGYQPLALLPDITVYDRFSLPDGKEKIKQFIFRPFEGKDIPLTVELLKNKAKGFLYSFVYDENWVRMFALDYFEENSDLSATVYNLKDEPVGVILCYTKNCDGNMGVLDYVFKPGISHLEAMPAVMEFLSQEGDKQMGINGGCKHIAVPYDKNSREILMDSLSRIEYANRRQCKVVDIPRFIKKIAPVLEKRIAASPICGYTRTVGIQLFGHKKGLTLALDNGHITDVAWCDVDFINEALDIQIPYEKFICLLFGVESIDDMRKVHREVNSWNRDRLDNEMRLLLKVLFPEKLSYIMHSC